MQMILHGRQGKLAHRRILNCKPQMNDFTPKLLIFAAIYNTIDKNCYLFISVKAV